MGHKSAKRWQLLFGRYGSSGLSRLCSSIHSTQITVRLFMSNPVPIALASVRRTEADGVSVFYREAGPEDGPVLLLLHGFPASSFQYRDLMLLLADR